MVGGTEDDEEEEEVSGAETTIVDRIETSGRRSDGSKKP
jgi:hypothetical protein